MRIKQLAIFHYHMNPGGVTRIIESQVESLNRRLPDCEIKVFAGGIPEGGRIRSLGAEVVEDPRLNYLPESVPDPQAHARDIASFIASQIPAETLIHFHNLNLGKNPLVTYAVHTLLRQGYRVLNHAHDFAEDRPENWQFLERIIGGELGAPLESVLYPEASNYQCAVLTGHDRNRLLDRGVAPERVHLLPNPVSLGDFPRVAPEAARAQLCRRLGLDESKRIVTYPVRVIRRKNIGEYILLATLLQNAGHWLVTQPPKNPVEAKPYREWKDFCRDRQIQLHFEVGTRVEYPVLMQGSDICFSTSIKEGFGMVFLEPWLAGKPVAGRNLAMVTDDFRAEGIHFPLLYDAVMVQTSEGRQDFGAMAAPCQRACIQRCLDDPSYRESVFADNPFIREILEDVDERIIENNRERVARRYSLSEYGHKLYGIYSGISGTAGES
jgi:glycosyltransferase involved in cell wall biosynthesis